MKLGFILLAHEAPEKLFPLLDALTAFDDTVVLHYDKSSPFRNYKKILNNKYPKLLFPKSIKVNWGEASIVQATLNSMKAIIESGEEPEYITLLSGSCYPIKSREDFCTYLNRYKGSEFIECHDISKSSWVKDGLEEERWGIFHFTNWRKNPRLFTFFHHFQRRLKISRNFPFGSTMFMGSQWWTLSLTMVQKILDISNKRMRRFLKTTWIPDEFYFQTLVGNLTESSYIKNKLMHYRFNNKGIPKVFTQVDFEELNQTNSFFARKFQQNNTELKNTLKKQYIENKPLGNIEKKVPFPQTLNGFSNGRINFRMDFRDYLLPVVIILDCRKDSLFFPDFWSAVKEAFPDFHIFGNIFSEDHIDYGLEKPFPLYGEQQTILRDFNTYEFLSYFAQASPMGFCFHIDSHNLPYKIDSLKEMPNLTLIDLWDEDLKDLQTIKNSYMLENYVSAFGCHYKRLFKKDKKELQTLMKTIICNNIYLRKKEGTLKENG